MIAEIRLQCTTEGDPCLGAQLFEIVGKRRILMEINRINDQLLKFHLEQTFSRSNRFLKIGKDRLVIAS